MTEGDVGAGDPIEILERHPAGIAVSEITRLFVHDHDDVAGLEAVLGVDVLPDDWRPYFEREARAGRRGPAQRRVLSRL